MDPTYYAMLAAGKLAEVSADKVSDEDLKIINTLKRNGPLRKLTADDIYVRAMYCIGESATTKLSIHPEGELNGKTINTLSTLAKLLPGAPMMEGHRMDKIPWARIFKASVEHVDNENVVKAYYYFLRDIPEYDKIAKEIDAGIRGEGSISYWFKTTRCSICHGKLDRSGWNALLGEKGYCQHELGKKYDGQICYWYPADIKGVAELSHVFRGAWEKTKGAMYSPEIEQYFNTSELEGAKALDELLQERLDGKPEEKKGICPSCKHAFVFPEDSEEFKCPECETLINKEGKAIDLGRGDGKGKGGPRQGDGGADKCVCPKCGHEVKHEKGTPCQDTKCPKCGAKMEGKNGKVKNCASCNAELAEGQVFCSACGTRAIPESLLGSPVGLTFPAKTDTINNEYFAIEAFENFEGEFYVEPLYDGVSVEAHKDGDTIKLLDGSLDLTDRFPGIVAELKAIPVNDFIVTGDIVKTRGHQRLFRKDVLAHISAEVLPEDKAFRFKASDILYLIGNDLRESPLTERKEKLSETIKGSESVNLVKFEKVEGGSKLVKKLDELASREGCAIKLANSVYSAESDMYSWKRQKELNVTAARKTEKDGKFMYGCEVSGKPIGTTYATEINVNEGAPIRVTVASASYDKDTEKYSCETIEVIESLSKTSTPDPVSTLDRIAALKVEPVEPVTNAVTLNDIIPGLIAAQRDYKVYLCGDLVENGESTDKIDLVVHNVLNEDEHKALVALFPDQHKDKVNVTVNETEPPAPFIELFSKAPEVIPPAEKPIGKFVLQKHWWNNKPHWDFRLNAYEATELTGFTCFKDPLDGSKVMCQEKRAHELKWMDVDGKISPREDGNPTKSLDAYMRIRTSGTCEIIRQENNFLEVVLKSDKLDGRYIFRELEIKKPIKHFIDINGVKNDEVATKTEKLWVMFKPKDQEAKGKLMDIGYKYEAGCLMLWDTKTEWRTDAN